LNVLKSIVGCFVALVILGLAFSACGTETDSASKPVATAPAEEPAGKTTAPETTEAEAEEKAEAEEEPEETAGQQNARESAESYLDSGAFSRAGLIKQLKFEGYSQADAVYAVNALEPNWNELAGKSAQSYLDSGAFSRSGLIKQLMYEGYTRAQAEYGVKQVGL
jgi:hypothetical protein